MDRLKRLLADPFLNFAIGLMMVLATASSIAATLLEDIKHLNFRLHHGVLAYALLNMAAASLEIYEKSRKLYERTAKLRDARTRLGAQRQGGEDHEDLRRGPH